MNEADIERTLAELNLPREDGDSLLEEMRAQGVSDALSRIKGTCLADIGDKDLSILYNRFFIKEKDGIPYWGPYSVPRDVMIKAMKTNTPLNIEKYRNKSTPPNVVF